MVIEAGQISMPKFSRTAYLADTSTRPKQNQDAVHLNVYLDAGKYFLASTKLS